MNFRALFMGGFLMVCGMASGINAVAAQPHLQRSGTNLVSNPDMNGNANGWSLAGAVYDSAVSRDAGTGSLKSTSVTDAVSGLDYMAVTPGNNYTLAFYLRSAVFPPVMPTAYAAYYDSNRTFTRNAFGTYMGVTELDSWQECVLLLRPQAGEAYARIKIKSPAYFPGTFWVDNFYFGQNIGFEQAPAAKTPFNGSQTKVDELGNIEICKNGVWQPFFPIAVYGADVRPDWTFYSAQGFNMNMWAGDYLCVQRARDAVSDFNPDGMMSGFDITSYILPSSANYNNLTLMQSRLNNLRSSGLMNSVVWYYWDNEAYGEWIVPLNVTNAVRAADRDAGNNLMHPIYALQGSYGIARKYSNSQVTMTDIIGSYVTPDTVSAILDETRGSLKLIALGNLEKQQNPVVVAQINHGVGNLFRPRVFNAIAHGARGIGFWRDDPQRISATPIEEEPWWNDLPNIRREIDQLLPIIRTPHWTSWSLSANNSLIDFGSRDYKGQAYVIVANDQSTAQSVTFTVSGLTSYAPTAVKDFFSHEIEAEISNSQFTVSIPAYGSKVYVLEDAPEEMLQLYLAFSESAGSSAVADWSFFANGGNVLNGAALSGGLLALDGIDDRINCGRDSSLDMGAANMTVIARIKLSTTPNPYSGIVTKGAGSSANAGYAFVYYQPAGNLLFPVCNGTSRQTLSSNGNLNLHDDAWHTVGVSLDRGAANCAAFYVDGNPVGGEALSIAGNFTNADYDALIGSWIGSHHFKGQINSVKVFRKAFTPQEMADLSNCALDQDMSHANAVDASFYGNDGSLLNGAAISSGALMLDGTDDRVNLARPSSLEINDGSVSVIARIKLGTTPNQYSGIITKGAGSSTNAGYAFVYYQPTGDLRFPVCNGTSRQTLNSNGNLNLHDDAWHTVGVSLDRGAANSATFYVDGSPVGSEALSIAGSFTNAAYDALIGSWIGSHHFKGQIDRIKIYKRTLSGTEMQNIANQWNR
jgi:hypothetical protein